MGAGESKRDSSVSYDVNEESKGVLELPQDLHSGPIHSLAAVDGNHLLSGGADRVLICMLASCTFGGGRAYCREYTVHIVRTARPVL